MTTDTTIPEICQVDFYLLGDTSMQAGEFAGQLALMAWEQKQHTYIIVATESLIGQLDEQMWRQPDQRFLPHSAAGGPNSSKAPVVIGTLSGLLPTDVVINLCPDTVPQTERYKRILEIVPYADCERQTSRVKYRAYRNLGLNPQTHEIN